MEDNPLLSVIIPIYNVRAYLQECLDSVINQTYTNLEIICIDDGSPDDSGKIADRYAEKDSRVKVIHQQNAGQGAARNAGLKMATGEYVGFIDSDDFIAPDFYYNLMSACQDDDVVLTTAVIRFHQKDELVPPQSSNQIIDVSNNREKLILGLGIACNKIYKRSFLQKNDIWFYPQKNLIEDNYFTVKVLLTADRIKATDNAVYYYRMNETSTIHSKLTDKDFICLDIAKGIEEYKTLAPDYAKVIDKKISRELRTFYRRLSFPYKREFKQQFKQSFPNLKIAIRKPLKWIYAAYNEGDIVYHSFFGDRLVIKRKKS